MSDDKQKQNSKPTDKAVNGRKKNGQFAKGHNFSQGVNHYNEKVRELRRALADAITANDILDIAKVLIQRAKNGDVQAVRELLDRTVGKPIQPVDAKLEGGVSLTVTIHGATQDGPADLETD